MSARAIIRFNGSLTDFATDVAAVLESGTPSELIVFLDRLARKVSAYVWPGVTWLPATAPRPPDDTPCFVVLERGKVVEAVANSQFRDGFCFRRRWVDASGKAKREDTWIPATVTHFIACPPAPPAPVLPRTSEQT